MSYTKHTWTNGELITASGMNQIENELVNLNQTIDTMGSDINEELQEKANSSGNYDDLTAGSANQLLSTTGVTDKAPYTLRTTGGGAAGIGDRAVEKIVGGTVCWNQQAQSTKTTFSANGLTYTNNNDGSWTVTGVSTGTGRSGLSSVFLPAGHVGCLLPNPSDETLYGNDKIKLCIINTNGLAASRYYAPAAGGLTKITTHDRNSLGLVPQATGYDLGTGLTLTPQFFDLTAMFGSAVADAVYAMEQASTGAGVAWFRAMFPKAYYPYNAGELMSVQTSGKQVTSADGTVTKLYPLDSTLTLRGIPKWDSAAGAMYYDGDEYASDGTVTRKYGVVDLGTLTYSYSGSYFQVSKNVVGGKTGGQYGTVLCARYPLSNTAESSLDKALREVSGFFRFYDSAYTDANSFKAAMSGVYLVYELATPTTESADPYTGAQWADNWGTEEFIDAGTGASRVAVPVGHVTHYPIDLKAKLESAPGNPDMDGDYVMRRSGGQNSYVLLQESADEMTETVTGSTPEILAESGWRYVCGTVTELNFTPCASGTCSVRFICGATVPVLTLPNTVIMPGWWKGVEANHTYAITITDGVYAEVDVWKNDGSAETYTDTTLTTTGVAADAKATGDAIADVTSEVSDVKSALDDIAGKEISMTGRTLFLDGPIGGATIKSVAEEAKSSFVLSVSHGNVMPWPYFRTSPFTTNGVTFVINADGSITANGTATADIAYTVGYMPTNYPSYYRESNDTPLYGYYLSGCTDGADDTYYLLAVNSGIKCKTNPVPVFTANGAVINIQIVVKSGVTLTDKTFYPMLSPTADTEYSAPVAYRTVSLESSMDEYTWDGINIPDGTCVIASNPKTTLTLTTDTYDTIASVRQDLDALAERVPENHWKGKKWVAFGTSITDNYSTNSYITQGEHTGEHTGKYVPYLLDMSELSASAFVNRGISGGSINGHILYYIRYYTSDQAGADLITIEGAVNDFAVSVPLGQVGDTVPYTNSLLPDGTSEGSFAGACYQAFTTAIENAPNAVVVLLTETTGKNHTGYTNYYPLRKNDLGLYQSDYIDMTIKVADFVGIPVITCGRDSMINAQNSQYIADHIHHTYLGGYQYARTIWAKLKGIPLKALSVPS